MVFSCIPSRRLDGGKGNKVPYKGYKFANKSKFDSSIYKEIDPDYFYELVDIYESNNHFEKIREFNNNDLWVKDLQFYTNGNVRRFAKKYANPNPEITGNRGIIYKQGNKIKIDFYEGISGGGDMAIVTYQVKIEGDKIYLREIDFLNSLFLNSLSCSVYQKSEKIPEEYKKYKVDW